MTLYESFMLLMTTVLVAGQIRFNGNPILWGFVGLAAIISGCSLAHHLGAFLKGIL